MGGDGYARRLCVRETEEGDERGRVRGGSRGVRGGVGDVQAMRGKRQEAGGGRARAGVPRPRALSIGAGRKTTGEGPGGLGRPLGPPGGCTGELAQVRSLSLLCFLNCFSFLFFCNCFGFSFNTKPFYKILKINM